MTPKIEARRFSGKQGTWSHYAMAVKAHFSIEDLTKYFNDGMPLGRVSALFSNT